MQIPTMSASPAALRRPIGPLAVGRTLIEHRALVSRMAKRDIVDRYRGSVLGLLWSFFHPVAMLLIYTFVFSFVLGTTWPGSGGGSIAYALNLFAGLIVYSLFSESVTRAPALIVDNR